MSASAQSTASITQSVASATASAVADNVTYSPYGYMPIFALSIIGSMLMLGITLHLTFLYFAKRSWFFHMILVGAIMESAGYVIRAANAHDLNSTWMWLVQFMLLILAPSFIAAACYMAFGRLVWFVTPLEHLRFRSLWVPRRGITPLFVFFDLLSFAIQVVGVGQLGGSQSKGLTVEEQQRLTQNGERTLKLGLVLQLMCFGIFALIGTRFLVVSRKWGVVGEAGFGGSVLDTRWQRLNWAINGAATMIMLRAIYRIFDFSTTPATQYLKTHEWVFWLFDCLPILIALGLFCIFHPSYYLPHSFCGFRLNKKQALEAKKSAGTQIYPLQEGGPYAELGGDKMERKKPGRVRRFFRWWWRETDWAGA